MCLRNSIGFIWLGGNDEGSKVGVRLRVVEEVVM